MQIYKTTETAMSWIDIPCKNIPAAFSTIYQVDRHQIKENVSKV